MFCQPATRGVIMTERALYGCTRAGTDKIRMTLRCAAWYAANTRSYWFTQSR